MYNQPPCKLYIISNMMPVRNFKQGSLLTSKLIVVMFVYLHPYGIYNVLNSTEAILSHEDTDIYDIKM